MNLVSTDLFSELENIQAVTFTKKINTTVLSMWLKQKSFGEDIWEELINFKTECAEGISYVLKFSLEICQHCGVTASTEDNSLRR